MGKAAENERIKLKATYNNNIAVGLAVVGFLIPMVTLVQSLTPELNRWLAADRRTVVAVALPNLGAAVFALWASLQYHGVALKEVEKLQD